jgi:hypothetical protein
VARTYPSASSREGVYRQPSRVYWRPRRRLLATAATPRADVELVDDFETGAVSASWSIATNVSVSGSYARTGSYGALLDSSASFSRLRWDTSAFSTGRRWASLRCWIRLPNGAPTEDVALFRFRNTDPSSAGGGGNGDVWWDSADQTIRGDLQPGDFFTHPTPLTSNTWYQLHAVCGFKSDGTSKLRVMLDGVEIADVDSTLNDPAQYMQWVEFGSLSTQNDVFHADNIKIVVSDAELDYLPLIPSPIDLGRATESTAARALTVSKTTALGRATETTAARTLAASKTTGIARASEVDSARSVTLSKTASLGRATESLSARPVTVSKTTTVGRATETTTARTLSASPGITLGRATQTTTARPVTVSKTLSAGRASETTTARALTVSTVEGAIVTPGRATETTTARPVAVTKTVVLGRAAETDTARTLTAARVIAISRAASTTTARALTLAKATALGRATQTTTARAVTVTGGAAPETLPTNLGGALVSTGYGGSSVSQGYSGSLT